MALLPKTKGRNRLRIIVLSDTHTDYWHLSQIVHKHADADLFIHLGDGEEEYHLLCQNFPDYAPRFRYVKGNCDYGSPEPLERTIPLPYGHCIFACHGHKLGVKMGIDGLLHRAAEQNCDIALYGHTHIQHCTYQDGIYIMNPGSASCPRDCRAPSYGILDVTPQGIMTNIVSLT